MSITFVIIIFYITKLSTLSFQHNLLIEISFNHFAHYQIIYPIFQHSFTDFYNYIFINKQQLTQSMPGFDRWPHCQGQS